MSEPKKKIEKAEPDRKTTELSEQDLEQVAGGAAAPDPGGNKQKAQHKNVDI